MSMKYIRDYYGVPAKRGGRIRYKGFKIPQTGTITGSKNSYLRIRMDDENESQLFHPTWNMEYFGTESWDKA